MNNERTRKQREIIADLQEKKRLSSGQEKLDLTTEIVNEQEKLNEMLKPKKIEI